MSDGQDQHRIALKKVTSTPCDRNYKNEEILVDRADVRKVSNNISRQALECNLQLETEREAGRQ